MVQCVGMKLTLLSVDFFAGTVVEKNSTSCTDVDLLGKENKKKD